MTHYKTSLDRAQSSVTDSEIQARRDTIAAQAWQSTGTLAVSVNDDRLSWPERQMVKMIAAKLGYGAFETPAEELT